MMRILHFLWLYLREEKKLFFLVVIPMIIAFLVGPLVPLTYKEFIDLIAGQLPSAASTRALWRVAFSFFVMIVLTQVGWKTLEYWLVPLENAIGKRIYRDAFHHILGQSHQFFSGQPAGSIVRIVARLADTIIQFIDTLIFQVMRVSSQILVMVVVLWVQHVMLGFVITVWMTLLVIIKGQLWRRNFIINAEVASASTRISGQISDVFSNAFTVLTFGTSQREMISFRKMVDDWALLQRKMWWQEYRIFFTTTVFLLVLQIGAIMAIIYYWSHGVISAGTCTLVLVYMTLFINQAIEINHIFRSLYRQSADMKEAIDLLSVKSDIVDHAGAKNLSVQKGAIAFEHVYFSYSDNADAVLEDLSLVINPGERVALVGRSGSGKSTILKLLFRLYDVSQGTISIDNQNIAKVTQESLRQHMSIVPQDPALFHRSIGENIGYAASKTLHKQDIESAAKIAHAHDFIKLLPAGYDTLVGERGVKLSGGERQRVALARAVLADRPILVLDEATSSLDSESEKYIQDSLHTIMQGRTTIVIAHRLSTIMQMDRIIVMDAGKIIEEGTHEDLIVRKNGAYRKLWDIQTGEFIRDIE